MFNTFVLLLGLTLANGSSYTPNAITYPSFTDCMNTAMAVTTSYRKSDLKHYTVQCLKVSPETTSED